MNNSLKVVCLQLAATVLFISNSFTALGQANTPRSGFDSAKAIKELQFQNEKFISALEKGDSIALGSLYTADAKIFNHANPSTIGRGAIIKFYGEIIRAGVTRFSYTTAGIWGGDNNLVVEEGALVFALANGRAVAKGRYLIVWKREEGELKIFRDSFSSDGKINN